jgi:hypothetical protein
VALDFLACEHRRVDSPAIVSHPQSEFLSVVADLNLDSTGMCVPVRITERLGRDLIDLVTCDRVQISRLPFDCHTECEGLVSTWIAGEFVAQCSDGDREIVAFDGRYAQALHGVAAFGDRLRRLLNRAIEFLFRVRRMLQQHERRGLKSQQ